MRSGSVAGSATVASVGSAASALSTSASIAAPMRSRMRRDQRVVGAQERGEQVDRGHLRVLALGGEGERGLDGLAGLLREAVELHRTSKSQSGRLRL